MENANLFSESGPDNSKRMARSPEVSKYVAYIRIDDGTPDPHVDFPCAAVIHEAVESLRRRVAYFIWRITNKMYEAAAAD
jgi:hypothetical protein